MARFSVRHASRSLLLVAAGLLAGCSGRGGGLRALAASSLTGILDEAVRMYAAETGTFIEPSFAATSTLARQIEAGAPADVFISADKIWMDRLESGGYLRPGTRMELAGNILILMTNQPAVKTPLDCKRLALADPDHVPAGVYGRQALKFLGQWSALESKILVAVDVRAAAAYVDRGDVPCAVVYASELKTAPRARRAYDFPAQSHAAIRYPAAVLARSRRPDAAADFLAWLADPQRHELWGKHGFTFFKAAP